MTAALSSPSEASACARPTWIYDARAAIGYGGVFALTPEWLSFRSEGVLGGSLANDIPVASVVGFYLARYRFVSAVGVENGRHDELIVAWRYGATTVRNKWTIADSDAPAFQSLLVALARLRPDANLLPLPSGEAHRRLGMWSMGRMAIVIALAIVGGVLLVVFGLFALLLAAG